MTNDLLFSVLPREGKVPIAHESQKVVKIDKLENMRVLSDEEKELKCEEREAREQQQRNQSQQDPQNKSEHDDKKESDVKLKKTQGPTHLDIYI